MDPEVHYVTDRDAGIALITGQIVEAWLARQPKARAIAPKDLCELIIAVRSCLSVPVMPSAELPASRKGSAPTPLRPVS